ncbi:MAG: hypothetical protein GY786_19805 [Proteobacteria bacterium]|nr:hypothetical protein [Pseudomonadota bacterium]
MRSLKTQGVALLMSLSVILLLSIVLMQSFENRSVEVKHLQNTQNFFQASILSRSVFRVLLTIIKEQGVYGLHIYSNRIQGMPVPLEDLGENILISQLEIKSLDHLYNINKKLKTSNRDNIDQLRNLIELIKQDGSADSDLYELEEQIINFTSALIDWTDTDSDLDITIDYGSGGEDYYEAKPTFEVKNREIEFLDELNLLPSFRALNLSKQQIANSFRPFYSKTNVTEAIDINLASKEEIVNFLKRYQTFSTKYPNIITYLDDIANMAKDEESSVNSFNPEAKYEGKLYKGSRWQEEIESITGVLALEEQKLFSFRTYLLRIQYDLYSDNTLVSVESVLGLKYSSDNNKNDIDEITILDFKIL